MYILIQALCLLFFTEFTGPYVYSLPHVYSRAIEYFPFSSFIAAKGL